jgi:hypothetical protein
MMPRTETPAPLAFEDTRIPPSTVSIRRTRLDTLNDGPRSLPVVNYASAIAKAVEWLGDRYLLATVLGVTQARVSDLKRGKFERFSMDLLVRLAARAGLKPKLKLAA